MTAYLTDRQRATPPPPRGGRRAHSAGGYAEGGEGVTLARGLVSELSRYSPTVFDGEIRRERTPWYPREYAIPGGQSWVNWTAAGPIRAELGMRNVTLRTMAGTSNTRADQDPANPRQGLHTNPVNGVARTVQRYMDPANPAMTAARVDRLSNARYDGQSYSQTTRTQGGRVKR